MKVEQHLETLLDKFRATAADDKSRPAAKFLVVLVMIRSWFHKQGSIQTRPGPQQQQHGKPADAPPSLVDGLAGPALLDTSVAYTPSPSTKSAAVATAAAACSGNTTPLSATHRLAPQPQPQQPSYASTAANTPLHLLSEIATNNGAVGSMHSPSGPGPRAGGISGAPGIGSAPWLNPAAPHPQPFMYDNPGPRGSSSDTASGTVGGTPNPPVSEMMPPGIMGGAGPTPWLSGGFLTEFDYTGLGEGFAQAMDLTLTAWPTTPTTLPTTCATW